MLNELKRINKLIKEASVEKKPSDPITRQVKNELNIFANNFLNKFGYSNELVYLTSVGKGTKNTTPWISFMFDNNKIKKVLEGIYITAIFIAETNSVFLTIQGSSEKYRTNKQNLLKVAEFFKKNYYEKIIESDEEIQWRNSTIENGKILNKPSEPITTRTNSYLYTSIFYKLIHLTTIEENELTKIWTDLFFIFLKNKEIFNNFKKLKIDLDIYIKNYEIDNEDNFDELYQDWGKNKEIIDSSDHEIEKINLERPSNLSKKHKEIQKILYNHFTANGWKAKIEKFNYIDLYLENENTTVIFEIKTAENEIYKAIGQILVYENEVLRHNVQKQNFEKIILFDDKYDFPFKIISTLDKLGIKLRTVNDFIKQE